MVKMFMVLHKWYQSGLLCTRLEENVKSHSGSVHAICKVVVQIEARLTVSSFGPDSGGSEEQTTSRSVVQNSPVGKKWLVEGRLSIGLFFSQKPPFFIPFEALVP
eukprot:Gb_15425 [translate_table: standard]